MFIFILYVYVFLCGGMCINVHVLREAKVGHEMSCELELQVVVSDLTWVLCKEQYALLITGPSLQPSAM